MVRCGNAGLGLQPQATAGVGHLPNLGMPSKLHATANDVEAVDRLIRRRFMICDDTQDIVTRLLQAGLAAGVPAPSPDETSSASNPVPACIGRPHHRYHHVYDQDGDRD
jgi:hypothetical protein